MITLPWRLFCCILLWCLAACQQQAQDFKETRFLLGTIVEFTVVSDDETLALQAIKQASEVMQAVEARFTTFGTVKNSVKQFNQAKVGAAVLLDDKVEALLLLSQHLHELTQGSFDPTLGVLNKQWGFSGDKQRKQPLAKATVQEALLHSGMKHVQRNTSGYWLKSVAGLELDFGAIAKGFAIDEGIRVLEKLGIKHAIINAGGDMRILGDHAGQPWKIAIRHPRAQQPLGWFTVEQSNSIVTSGDYERFFIDGGKRYHHIIDPKTGYPSTLSMSVTVSAPTAAEADALSTAMFILGAKQGLPMIEAMSGVEAIWVDMDSQVYQSSGMKTWFHKL